MIRQNNSVSLPNTSYHPEFLSTEEANALFEQLLTYSRLTSMLVAETPGGKIEFDFGKVTYLEREVYGSGKFFEAAWGPLAVFPSELLKIRDRLTRTVGDIFEVCVAIYYPNGDSWVDFHSDKPAFGDTNVIASISLGAERTFSLKENATGTIFSQILGHGSLLIMEDGCQDHYEHSLPQDSNCNQPRINLTFRKLGFQ